MAGGKTQTPYDSTIDSKLHIEAVQQEMDVPIKDLQQRAGNHDSSKLESPELEALNKYVPLLKKATYGTPQHKELIEKLTKEGGHYEQNDHHPEHYQLGVNQMNLNSVLEMVADWTAASKQRKGSMSGFLSSVKKRWGIGKQLAHLIVNQMKAYHSDAIDQPLEVFLFFDLPTQKALKSGNIGIASRITKAYHEHLNVKCKNVAPFIIYTNLAPSLFEELSLKRSYVHYFPVKDDLGYRVDKNTDRESYKVKYKTGVEKNKLKATRELLDIIEELGFPIWGLGYIGKISHYDYLEHHRDGFASIGMEGAPS